MFNNVSAAKTGRLDTIEKMADVRADVGVKFMLFSQVLQSTTVHAANVDYPQA